MTRERRPVEIADIFRKVVTAGKLRASPEQWKAVNAIMQCRTAALGGHLYQCKGCGDEQPQYNSCRNRHCPKCQGADIAKWMKAREVELLPVPYFHTVFTVPHELNIVFLQNKKEMYSLLFQAVSETIRKAASSRYGGQAGFFGVLHTWGQKLEAHPHVHCVIPGLVLKSHGEVVQTPKNYFLPDRVLEKLFRGIFLEKLQKLYARKKLSFFQNAQHLSAPAAFQAICSKAASKEWVVYSKAPFAGPEAVLKYLSRYTHRVAITNARIKEFDGNTVTFSYKDYAKNGKRRLCSLAATEFSRRFLLHALPKQFVRIRHFGFLANRKKQHALQIISSALETISTNEHSQKLHDEQLSEPKAHACIHCGSTLFSVRKISKTSSRLIDYSTNSIIPHRTPPPDANRRSAVGVNRG